MPTVSIFLFAGIQRSPGLPLSAFPSHIVAYNHWTDWRVQVAIRHPSFVDKLVAGITRNIFRTRTDIKLH